MKIGFNIQKIKDLIKNSISSLETRVTTLENNSGGGGGGTQLSSFNFKILNVNNIEILEKTVKSIENDLSISLVLQFTLQDTNRNMVDYGVIDLGSCKLSDNENQRYKCEGTLPIIYQKGDDDAIYYSGCLQIMYSNPNKKNIFYLIIDKRDIEMWKNFNNATMPIMIFGSGVFIKGEPLPNIS